MILQVEDALDSYRADFERIERDGASRQPQWINEIRAAAFRRFVELGFPATRLEDWKYTDVAPIARTRFKRVEQTRRAVPAQPVATCTLDEAACAQLVFVNGRYVSELSSLEKLPDGITVGSLATALADHPESVRAHLAQHVRYHDQAFVALNTAFIEDGAFVSIPNGTVVEAPIHLSFISVASVDSVQDRSTSTGLGTGVGMPDNGGGQASISCPRNLIVAGSGSRVRIVESYTGPTRDVYFTNAVTEIVGGENATIEYYKVQRESEAAFHVATVQAHLGDRSAFLSHTIDLGGALVRNHVGVILDGEGAECTLNGLYMTAGRQHVDNHTQIDHVRPHCSSRQLYKGILDGKSRGVFNGKIVVRNTAWKTDARQTNKNLLLSEDAVIDGKPQLEIFNNDVKCTHGTTIGRHDQHAMFYLRSRGIDLTAAQSLLTYAFASELLGLITIEPIRSGLEALLLARLGDGLTFKETP